MVRAHKYKVTICHDPVRTYGYEEIDELYVSFNDLSSEQNEKIKELVQNPDFDCSKYNHSGICVNYGRIGRSYKTNYFFAEAPRNIIHDHRLDAERCASDLQPIELDDEFVNELVDMMVIKTKLEHLESSLKTHVDKVLLHKY